jgi:hypothetical protein
MFNHGTVLLPQPIDWFAHDRSDTEMHRPYSIEFLPRPTAISASIFFGGIGCSGLYRAQPAAGHTKMTIGIDLFRSPIDRMPIQL